MFGVTLSSNISFQKLLGCTNVCYKSLSHCIDVVTFSVKLKKNEKSVVQFFT